MCLFFTSLNELIFQNECELFDKKIINFVLNKTMIHSKCLKNKHDYSFHKNAKKSVKTAEMMRMKIQILG